MSHFISFLSRWRFFRFFNFYGLKLFIGLQFFIFPVLPLLCRICQFRNKAGWQCTYLALLRRVKEKS